MRSLRSPYTDMHSLSVIRFKALISQLLMTRRMYHSSALPVSDLLSNWPVSRDYNYFIRKISAGLPLQLTINRRLIHNKTVEIMKFIPIYIRCSLYSGVTLGRKIKRPKMIKPVKKEKGHGTMTYATTTPLVTNVFNQIFKVCY